MSRYISNHPDIYPTWQTYIEPNLNWNTKWQFIYRDGWTYIWQSRHISDRADIYLTWQTYIEPFLYFEPKRRFIYRHGWTNNVISTSYLTATIYIVFFALCVYVPHMSCHFDIWAAISCQIEIMVGYVSRCPMCVTKNGSSYEPAGTINALPFHTQKPKWQPICVPTRHKGCHLAKKIKMAADMRANPTYDQPCYKISEMFAHVSRMAAHMIVFCRFSPLIMSWHVFPCHLIASLLVAYLRLAKLVFTTLCDSALFFRLCVPSPVLTSMFLSSPNIISRLLSSLVM